MAAVLMVLGLEGCLVVERSLSPHGGFALTAKAQQPPTTPRPPHPPGHRPPGPAHTERRRGSQGPPSPDYPPRLQPAPTMATASPLGRRTRAATKTTYVRTSPLFRAIMLLSGTDGSRAYGYWPCRWSSGGAFSAAAGDFARTNRRSQLPDVTPATQHTVLQPPPSKNSGKSFLHKTGNKGSEDTDCTSEDPDHTVK